MATPDKPEELRQEEFRRLVASADSRLKHFLLALTGNAADRDDVLQDTYEIAWRRFADFQEGTNFYQWVARIGLNQARNFNRKRRKHRGLGLSDEVLSELAQMNTGNAELLEMRQEQLRRCMNKLRPIDYALIIDYYKGDRATAELGTRYGMREDLIYKRLFRLRKKLFQCINRHLRLEGR